MTPLPAAPAAPAARQRVRSLLYDALRNRPDPVLAGPSFTIPGASLWAGARVWVSHLRRMGLEEGDRVVLALPPCPAHVEATIAAWWEGLSLCVVDHARQTVLRDWDARLLIAHDPLAHTLRPTALHVPDEADATTPRRAGPPSTGVALAIDKGGAAAWSDGGVPVPSRAVRRYSDADLVVALESAAASARLSVGEPVVCDGPWHSADVLLGVVWPALLAGAALFVDGPGAQDLAATGLDASRAAGSPLFAAVRHAHVPRRA